MMNRIDDNQTVLVKNISPLYHDDYNIDIMIAPIIEILNKKGYKTIASCSGHYHSIRQYKNGEEEDWNVDGYIYFEDKIPKAIPKGLGAYVDETCIRWKYRSYKKNKLRMTRLLNWVKQLPDITN